MKNKLSYEELESIISVLKEKLKEHEDTTDNNERNKIIGSLGHEFNNILMGIQGNLSLIFLDTDKSDIIHDRLKDIEKNINNGVKLTEQLFDFISGKTIEKKESDKKTNFNQNDYYRIKKEIGNYSNPAQLHQSLKTEFHPGYRVYESVNKGSATVLLIDDDYMILDIGKKMLEKMGLEVITAIDGHKAIEIYKKDLNRIDVVIIDMIMPELSGIDIYYRLKKINPLIKTILSSGYRKNKDIDRIINKGNSRFVQKPFNMEILTYEIGEILKY